MRLINFNEKFSRLNLEDKFQQISVCLRTLYSIISLRKDVQLFIITWTLVSFGSCRLTLLLKVEKLFPKLGFLIVCEQRDIYGKKNHNKEQKENSTSVSSWNMPFFVVVVSSFFSLFSSRILLNIKVQYTLNQHRHTEWARTAAMHNMPFIVSVLSFFRLCSRENTFDIFSTFLSSPESFDSRNKLFSPTRTHQREAYVFSAHRKFFTLTYPMQVCRFPRDKLIFLCVSLSLENVCLQPDVARESHIITRL